MSDFDDGGKAWPFGDKNREDQTERMERNKSVNCSHKKTQAYSDGYLLDWLRKFYETWIRCESTRGCYSLCEPHDCRCPKGRGIGECYCGREELDRLRDLLNELSSKNDQAHRRQTPPERTI